MALSGGAFPGLAALVFLAIGILAGPAWAGLERDAAATHPALAEAGWEVLRRPGKPLAGFAPGPDGAVAVSADSAVGFLVRKADKPTRFLAWRWRVDQAPPATDLRRKGTDDRPLAVTVFFPRDPGMFGFVRRAMAGDLPDGRVLSYVWGGLDPAGARFPSPYMGDAGGLVVLQGPGAPTGQWVGACVDLGADYRTAFDGEDPPASYLALSSDSEDSGGTVRAAITPPAFVDRCP
ncbi:DUF3047 domain-containing protein [Aerophototrophica crusticola]|uniref:DUF3047 domain-containing protein n=1 Tax=Aerophototrophica crusticola TaxID=1709002 RepID=A0A858R3W3_9PROT|nr:DUF3047 domain-containing protein [Rhodospirillaceae bacterium B3]